MYKLLFKRLLDFILSLVALIVLSPIMLIIAIMIRIKLGKPVIFKQKRPGKDEKIFEMYKFRTMSDKRDRKGNLLSDEDRLTKFGKLLRATSLDELPELFNILKGDMSIVGPRPQLVRDMVFMSDKQRKRHSVRQGLTGLAQVNGRNNISWEDKINYDLKYIDKITFINDFKIIMNTVLKVFKREGVSTEGMDTAEDFGDYLLRCKKITIEQYQTKQKEAELLLEDK
ncbi:sugar transferase [Thomasclavelia cocleata]|jgi:lipopolysaccharide/colanic/teichoic acid biosynthesis glycosyltransferase|uniref:Undecaprenyl phosphate N,N'-diacetylbacillosamine 1-phosphate transferase n=2 Tax=Thomasclavelia cocleata TaxID=69824 RepID=A0A829Z920_9FIRM|nr:sugar transferase [Thomasclavelia cocleata]MCI9132075.1 sugar transferase [Thomasclavelia cocleata]GFI40462.1 undecaprenyl phosphate N,N'-diacetylbacillosamine 1-phosphate transferase [Thomasclavelia cocleata]